MEKVPFLSLARNQAALLKAHLNISIWFKHRPEAGLLLLLALLLFACRPANPAAAPGVTTPPGQPVAAAPATLTPQPAVTNQPAATNQPADTPTNVSPTLTYTPAASPTFTPEPDPFASYRIDALAERTFGGGQLEQVETLAVNGYFTRTLFRYPSDGLDIYGFMNVPVSGSSPFPVIIALHGYIDPAIYDTIDYTTRYADALARAGFLVLHPNLRGYPPSDQGENLFRVGMAIDVLNLIALVKEQSGQPGPLELADPAAIGLWGHSMGGGITTRVITVSPDVRAAVLYGAMSGDEQKNFERIFHYFSNGQRGQEELNAPPAVFQGISPIFFLDRVDAAVSIHHGKLDADVPLAWSLDLCDRLYKLGKAVECFTYPDQPHTFHNDGDELFMQRMIDFFNRQLKSQ